MVVEIRDWCQNVGEYNTYNFCIWHFGLCVIVSKIDRCRSSDPPYEIAINPIFRSYRVSDVIIQSFLNRSRSNLVHTLVARRARSAISDCLVITCHDSSHNVHEFSGFRMTYHDISWLVHFFHECSQLFINFHNFLKCCASSCHLCLWTCLDNRQAFRLRVVLFVHVCISTPKSPVCLSLVSPLIVIRQI